jgi:hypothetical protein
MKEFKPRPKQRLTKYRLEVYSNVRFAWTSKRSWLFDTRESAEKTGAPLRKTANVRIVEVTVEF